MKRWLVIGLLFFFNSGLIASIVPNLYDISLPSVTGSESEKQKLLQQGLLQILERVSGDSDISRQNAVKRALENPMDYIEQYTYQNNQLQVKYSPELVNSLINHTGKTVWGSRRPNVILWLVLEENQKKRIVGAETYPQIQSFLNQVAQQKGLPLVLPLMDLQDVSQVSAKDVWDHHYQVLQPASDRYGAQSILVGRIIQREGKAYLSHWDFLIDSESYAWQAEGQSIEEVLSKGISGTLRYLAKRSTAQNTKAIKTEEKPFLISVEDIQTAQDFSKVENYLRSLSDVMDVSVSQVLGSMAVFEITTQGDEGRLALEKALRVDQHLLATAHSSQQVANVELSYRWIPPMVTVEQNKIENSSIRDPMTDEND